MRVFPSFRRTDDDLAGRVRELGEAVARQSRQLALREATIADLRAQIAEEGWLRLSDEAGNEFGRDDVLSIAKTARAYALKNPLAKRAVDLWCLYTWGQDLSVSAKDPKVRAVVDRFWTDNQKTLTGQKANREFETELRVTGNHFLALFANAETGQLLVRPVPLEEVTDVLRNPEDRTEVRFYRRRWTQAAENGGGAETREALHPDWRYKSERRSRPPSLAIGGQDVPILWDVPIAHTKTGSFGHWKWGVSELYAALDWAKAYRKMLEDDASRSESLTAFAYELTVPGGAKGVAAAEAKFGTTLASGGLAQTETNPPPVAGSMFISGAGGDALKPINLSSAILPTDHSRPLRLMIAAAVGWPDTMLSEDPQQGALATAKTLDRPSELAATEARNDRKDLLSALIQYAIDADLAASGGILPKTGLTEEQRRVDLTWPSLLERDVDQLVSAIAMAATLNGSPDAGTMPPEVVSRLLLEALSVEDVDAILAKLEAERARREEMARQIAQRQPAQPPATEPPVGQQPGPAGPGGQPATESLAEAKTVTIADEDLADARRWWDARFEALKGAID